MLTTPLSPDVNKASVTQITEEFGRGEDRGAPLVFTARTESGVLRKRSLSYPRHYPFFFEGGGRSQAETRTGAR